MAQEELQESKLTKAGGRKPTHGCNYPMVGWPSVILTPMGPSLNLTREGISRPSLRSSLSLSLSQEQGGFRAHCNTIHQLEVHTMLLEDARLNGQDIFTLMVDLKEAFDTINHQKMYQIMQDLGYPSDAVQVVRGLYENAFTQVVTPYGNTPPIKV